jgi:hypothetical protein
MDGLSDERRPGAPREIGDDKIAATIRKTLETRPKGATHWSLRTMAKEIGHAPSRGRHLSTGNALNWLDNFAATRRLLWCLFV